MPFTHLLHSHFTLTSVSITLKSRSVIIYTIKVVLYLVLYSVYVCCVLFSPRVIAWWHSAIVHALLLCMCVVCMCMCACVWYQLNFVHV